MNKLQEITLDKYRRKISYALSKPLKDQPDSLEMKKEIGHAWGANDCIYCNTYSWDCYHCPLKEHGSCCNGLWEKMNNARSWKTWIQYARKILKYVERYG